MRSGRRWGWVAAVWLGGLGVALAGTNYEASVRAGEAAQRAGHGSAALVEYSAALAQAANTTERALALAKKATVHAYVHQDYAAAQAAARSALDLTNARPVARVTALQVLAECQMKAEGDNVAAAGTLEEALLLPEVDWARPTLLLRYTRLMFTEYLRKRMQDLLGYGLAMVFVTPWLAKGLAHFNNFTLSPVLLLVFFIIGILADRS